MKKIAIIGSGFIGRAWAITFARAGYRVALWDQDAAAPVNAISYIETILPDLAKNDLLRGLSESAVRSNLIATSTLEETLDQAIYVQENTPENLDIKKTIFGLLDSKSAHTTILASSTSALLPSAFTKSLNGRDRCLVVHPINPPYLIPAVEIVPAPWTRPDIVRDAADLLRAVGQSPIVMKKEIDGFVMNRMQGALLEEAFRLVAEGYATVEDVDTGIRDGLALRWSFMGPFETIDLNAPGGVRDYVERYQEIYARIFPSVQWRADWNGSVINEIEAARREKLPAEALRERQAWRDRRLMALIAHKRHSDKDIGR